MIFGFAGWSCSAAESRSADSLDPGAGVARFSEGRTSVPAWDASGLGPLPWQGIACVDVNDDASRIAVGTIAPPGDPNVFVFDAEGEIVVQQAVGQRWIDQIAVEPKTDLVRAMCTIPAGTAADGPEVYTVSSQGSTAEAPTGFNGESFRWYFHYGDHSNHVTRLLRRAGNTTATATAEEITWWMDGEMDRRQSVRLRGFPTSGIVTALAAGDGGFVLVGWATPDGSAGKDSNRPLPPNLILVRCQDTPRQSATPQWSRPCTLDVDPAPTPELGDYGTPIPNGDPGALDAPAEPPAPARLQQYDQKIYAPLSVALRVPPSGSDSVEPAHLRIAAADYQGWHRWVRSNASRADESRCVRFMPSRPTVRVYDGSGREIRVFPPERFAKPGWFDLLFFAGGNRLLARPHHWTSRGLAGQTRLPADDNARELYVLDVETGAVRAMSFPAPLCDVAASGSGRIAASCWDGRAYLLDEADLDRDTPPAAKAVQLDGPSMMRLSRDGRRMVAAGHAGVVSLWDETGNMLWRRDLNRLAQPGEKPWIARAKASRIAEGLWVMPVGRYHSALGREYLIEAPDGLILIEAHSGLSFDEDFAAIQHAGLDPMRVKYVLATHEHGDHTPGAYLWRVVTGAKFVAAREAAYTMQHHIPMGTGYGFHPPIPTDIVADGDCELNLAGLSLRGFRSPGHTFGSMAWMFEREGKSYLATGDLVGPGGKLGYSGSVNFSAHDALQSLERLAALKADFVLPGHGGPEDATVRLMAGQHVGRATGWNRIRPSQPEPRYGITAQDVLVVGRLVGATSADVGDLNVDGRPDVAIVSPMAEGAVVRIYLNQGGRFAEQPDETILVRDVEHPSKIRACHLDDDQMADILVSGSRIACLRSARRAPGGAVRYEIRPADVGTDVNQVRRVDLGGQTGPAIMLASRHKGWSCIGLAGKTVNDPSLQAWLAQLKGAYADLCELDVNGDGRTDLLNSYGLIFLRQTNGTFPSSPTLTLPPAKDDWTLMGTGDFNGDRRPDVALLAHGMKQAKLALHLNTGSTDVPYRPDPDAAFDLTFADEPAQRRHLLRDSPTVGDFNGDGFDDLILGKAKTRSVLILLGGPSGLSQSRSISPEIEFLLHHETGLRLADFDADGDADLAAFGYTEGTAPGFGYGPLGIFIWLQP